MSPLHATTVPAIRHCGPPRLLAEAACRQAKAGQSDRLPGPRLVSFVHRNGGLSDRLAHGDSRVLIACFKGDRAVLEHRLERAVGEDLLVRGRIAQLALRTIQLVPLVADLAPYEVDRVPSPVNEHTAVELLVDTAAVLGRMLVVERFAQVLQLSFGKSLVPRENWSFHGVRRAVGTRDGCSCARDRTTACGRRGRRGRRRRGRG